MKKPFYKTIMTFKKWVRNIQTAVYNGARTVCINIELSTALFMVLD